MRRQRLQVKQGGRGPAPTRLTIVTREWRRLREERIAFEPRRRQRRHGVGFANFLQRSSFWDYTNPRDEAKRRWAVAFWILLGAGCVALIAWFVIESARGLALF